MKRVKKAKGSPHNIKSAQVQSRSQDWDLFISHSSNDEKFAVGLKEAVEREFHRGKNLRAWLDVAEIGPGASIPAKVNEGLSKSRYFAMVLSPDYFNSMSGWTDAEWHSMLHVDPDNRKGHILPLLAKTCPYIPPLLIHLFTLDFRKAQDEALSKLLAVLRDEPIFRPISHRGQLITPDGRISRVTLFAERSVPQSDPDVVKEKLYCNLLPVLSLPNFIYSAPIKEKLCREKSSGSIAFPNKEELRSEIRRFQSESKAENPFMPAFRIHSGRIWSFHDLEDPDNPLASITEETDIVSLSVADVLRQDDERTIVISLLNMSIARHAIRRGLHADHSKWQKFFFPPKDGGPNIMFWRPMKNKAKRTVAKPCFKDDGSLGFWRHQGAYLKMLELANKLYLQIRPTWVITKDGLTPASGAGVGKYVIKWTGPERNLQVLYHVRFWATVLGGSPGPLIVFRAGDQNVQISKKPAMIEQGYGIANDQKDLLKELDTAADLIAEDEDEKAELAAELELEGVDDDEGEFDQEAIDEGESAGDAES